MIGLILGPKLGDPEQVRQAKSLYAATQDASSALKLMPSFMHVECSLLRGLSRHGTKQSRVAML